MTVTTAAPAARLEQVRVVRGRRVVLDEVSLSVRAGAVTGLLGPSGSGKTTLMRAVVGVQARVTGAVEVLGRPAGTAVLRREVAYVAQGGGVYRDLTVAQNLRYLAALLGLRGRRREAAVDRALAVVGLADRRGDLVGRLSGGQESRVSLAGALLGEPRLLVLDEPTVGLDPVLRDDLWRTFAELARGGVSLLVSTHVMDEAARCEDLVLLREGRVLATGAPRELLDRTGAGDLDGAFLHLIREREVAA
ncbi:MAG: ABC transporter ATP-binding protein [Kineosporiaceae bacterium]